MSIDDYIWAAANSSFFTLEGDTDMLDVTIKGLLPGVAARIDEIETASGVLQPDARTTAVLGIGFISNTDAKIVFFSDKRTN